MTLKGTLQKPIPKHGTRERYQHRVNPCTCFDCRKANSEYIAEVRRRTGYIRKPRW